VLQGRLIHGYAVDELVLTQGDKGDPDLRFQYVDPKTFFTIRAAAA
jgi:hypothetical protein